MYERRARCRCAVERNLRGAIRQASNASRRRVCGKGDVGSAYGIRTRGLHLERVVSLAARRMRHATLSVGWGSRIRTSAYRSRVCRPTTRRIPNLVSHSTRQRPPYQEKPADHFKAFSDGHLSRLPANLPPLPPRALQRRVYALAQIGGSGPRRVRETLGAVVRV